MTVVSDVKRRDLHELLDAVPDHVLDAAREALEKLVDPARHALLNSPKDQQPVTSDADDGIEAGRAEMARGEIVSLEEVEDELLGRGL